MTKHALPAGWLAVVVLLACSHAGRPTADEPKAEPKLDAKAEAKPEPDAKVDAKAEPKAEPDAKVDATQPEAKQLQICGDPNNLPFSNEKLEGIENKIAEVVAKDLGMTVAYTWWPHQRGLVKRVLNTRRCDVMLGIPKGYDPVLWTKPYYRTGYVMAYRKDRGLKLQSLDDPQLAKLKIGVLVNTPPHDALGQRGIAGDNVIGYQLMFDSNFHAEDYPGKVVEDVIAGSIDVALVWGPIAGYFAKKKAAPLELVLLEDKPESGNRFAFDISMGVRKGNTELKAKLEAALARKHAEIEHILEDFGVPLLPAGEEKARGKGR